MIQAVMMFILFVCSLSGQARIHAGGAAVTDDNGRVWSADAGTATQAMGGTEYPIAGQTGVYSSMRYGAAFKYQIPTKGDGTLYWLRLKCIESVVTGKGQRVFDVYVDGERVLGNLDLIAVAGFKRPYDTTLVVDARRNPMAIEFRASVRTAVVSGLDVRPVSEASQLQTVPPVALKNLTTTVSTVATAAFTPVVVTPSTPVRVEFSYDTFSLAASDGARVLGTGSSVGNSQFGFRMAGSVLQFLDDIDGGTDGIPQIDIAGWDAARNDYGLSVRAERDPAVQQIRLTACHADGTGCVVDVRKASVWGSISLSAANIGRAGWGPGGNSLFGQLSLFRIATMLVSNSKPPNASGAALGDVANWEFEGSTVDTVSNAIWIGLADSYTATRPRLAVCNAGTTRTIRVGIADRLDGTGSYALDGSSAVTGAWTQTAGPGEATFSNKTDLRTSITLPTFGQYDFQLVVTDASGNRTAPCSVSIGAVNTDDKGNLIISNRAHALILTQSDPANPESGTGVPAFLDSSFVPDGTGIRAFPFFQQQMPLNARAMMAAVANAGLGANAEWNQPKTGTISFVANCTDWGGVYGPACSTVTGVGTQFQTDFCAGGNDPVQDRNIVIWYNSLLTAGTTGRRLYPVARCISQTQLLLGRPNSPWSFISEPGVVDARPGKTQGLQYSQQTDASGFWFNASAPGAYYDAPTGLYYLWYATGLNWYRDQARSYVDTWFSEPHTDGGAQMVANAGWWQLGYGESRVTSLLSLMMRAADERPEMWPGIRRIANFVGPNNTNSHGPVPDLRDAGIVTDWYGKLTLVDPDPAERDSWYAKLKVLYTGMWTPYAIQHGEDIWWNALDTGGGASSEGLQELKKAQGGSVFTGTATAVFNSSAVTGTDTNFLTSWSWNKCDYIWFTDASNTSVFLSNRDLSGDQDAYRVANIESDTSITLTRPYAGTSGTKHYVCTGYGPGSDNTMITNDQPFMVTISANGHLSGREAFRVRGDTEMRATAEKYAVGAASFVWNRTWDEVNGGHTYFWNPTSAMPSRAEFCYTCLSSNGGTDDRDGERINLIENASAYAILYRFRKSDALKQEVYRRMSRAWGKPATGAIYSDGNYAFTVDHGWNSPTAQFIQKWFGFVLGTGRNQGVLGTLAQ